MLLLVVVALVDATAAVLMMEEAATLVFMSATSFKLSGAVADVLARELLELVAEDPAVEVAGGGEGDANTSSRFSLRGGKVWGKRDTEPYAGRRCFLLSING